MDLYLLIRWSNQLEEERLPLFGQTVRIGHDRHNDVVLPGDFTPHAPYHAVIYARQGRWYIEDTEGVGSVYYNGEQVIGARQLSPYLPVYVGYPKAGTLYLRLEIEEPQLTVAMAPPGDDAGLVSQHIQNAPAPPPPPDAHPYLIYGWSDVFSDIHRLDSPLTVVGRNPAATLVLPNDLAFVSGYHFQLTEQAGAFVLEDKGSTNGTQLNGRFTPPDTPMYLQDGDIISIMVDDPGAVVWFVFHDPLNPSEQNIIREYKRQQPDATPEGLWSRIRRLLGR